jgi:hypothetical protein
VGRSKLVEKRFSQQEDLWIGSFSNQSSGKKKSAEEGV